MKPWKSQGKLLKEHISHIMSGNNFGSVLVLMVWIPQSDILILSNPQGYHQKYDPEF